jgi:hypothetical protein
VQATQLIIERACTSGITTQRGGTEQYNQWTGTIGIRFDNRSPEGKASHGKLP